MPDIVTGEVAVNVIGMLPTAVPVTVSVKAPETAYVPPGASDDGKRESVSEVEWASVLYFPKAYVAEYNASPVKMVLICRLPLTIFGAGPVAVKVPLGFVMIWDKPVEPLPLNIIV